MPQGVVAVVLAVAVGYGAYVGGKKVVDESKKVPHAVVRLIKKIPH